MITKYHFIGIKGAGMSALAQILHGLGHEVQGSDIESEVFTEFQLRDKNIRILPFDAKNIEEGYIYIAGNAFNDEHMEIKRARELGYEVIRYHEFLASFMKDYVSIGVTGAHGKTSTTGLLSHVMNGDSKTTYLIGDGTGVGVDDSEFFVFESCEYKRHFLSYHPDYAIITNIDFDHPDYYQNLEDVIDAFTTMANQAKTIVAYGGDSHVEDMQLSKDVWLYGFDAAFDVYAKQVEVTPEGTRFDVYIKGNYFETFTIPLFGNHHVLNALAVITICYLEELKIENIKQAFMTYEGVKRRFTETKVDDLIIVDDYAHHPIEIKATLETAQKKYPDKEIVSVFQPHTFSRTKTFLKEFSESLSQSDHVYIVDIFGSAREESGDLSSEDLVSITPNANLLKVDDIEMLHRHKNAVIIFMGAGDIQKYEKTFTESLK